MIIPLNDLAESIRNAADRLIALMNEASDAGLEVNPHIEKMNDLVPVGQNPNRWKHNVIIKRVEYF